MEQMHVAFGKPPSILSKILWIQAEAVYSICCMHVWCTYRQIWVTYLGFDRASISWCVWVLMFSFTWENHLLVVKKYAERIRWVSKKYAERIWWVTKKTTSRMGQALTWSRLQRRWGCSFASNVVGPTWRNILRLCIAENWG